MKQKSVPRSALWVCRKNQRGHSTLEVAFLMLPFLLLMMGVMEFGSYFLQQHTLQFATREGARVAMVGEIINDEAGDPLSRLESIKATVKKKAGWTMDAQKITFHVAPLTDEQGNPLSNYEDPDSFTDPTQAPSAGNPADYMRIEARYPHEFFSPLIGHLFDNDCSDGCSIELKAQTTYRNELFDL